MSSIVRRATARRTIAFCCDWALPLLTTAIASDACAIALCLLTGHAPLAAPLLPMLTACILGYRRERRWPRRRTLTRAYLELGDLAEALSDCSPRVVNNIDGRAAVFLGSFQRDRELVVFRAYFAGYTPPPTDKPKHIVAEEFLLDTTTNLVRHRRIDAVPDPEGNVLPSMSNDVRDREIATRLVRDTGIEFASVDQIRELIRQLRQARTFNSSQDPNSAPEEP